MIMAENSNQNQTQNSDHLSEKEQVQHFRELLLNGKIEEAVQFEDDNHLPEQAVQ